MPRTSAVVGLRCPVPDCHGMLRVLHVAHAVNGAYTRRSRVCRICGTRQTLCRADASDRPARLMLDRLNLVG